MKIQVGSEEFLVGELELSVLASALEFSTGMELEMPGFGEDEEDFSAS